VVIRGIAEELCAAIAAQESNAPANTQEGNTFIERIVVTLDPSCRRNPGTTKAAVRLKSL
jgi:hypothetical protein